MTTSLSPSMLYSDLGISLFSSTNQDGDCSVPGGRGVDQHFQVIRRMYCQNESCGGTGWGRFMSIQLQTLFPSVQSKVIEYKISRVSNEKPGLWVEVGLSSPATRIGDKLQKFMVNLFPVCAQSQQTHAHERCKESTG